MGSVMRHWTRIGLVIASACSIGSAALAQLQATSPPPAQQAAQPTYKSLLAQGYEIKSTILVNSDVASRLATNAQPDTVMVILQKGAESANCWITLSGWNAQNIGGSTCNVLQ
jgi:hypothetical protein